MKRNLLLLSILVVIMLVPVIASADGSITVNSPTNGATIWLDTTNNTGLVAPITLSVPNGVHTVVLKLAGYQPSTAQSFTVNNDTQTVSIPALISAPTITGISATSGINNGPVTIPISGTTFISPVTVTLTNGSTSISGANNIVTGGTSISSTFNINGAPPGTWNVVVLNPDGGTATILNAFTVISASSASTVTSITPNSGTVNTTVSVTIVGTGFQGSPLIHLTRANYNDIIGTVSTQSSTQITGTFNLNSQTPGAWTTRVYYDGSHFIDGPIFTIADAAAVNGTLAFSSNPSGAGAYLNNVFQAKTPYTMTNVTPGTYTITYKLSGYQDLSQTFTVTAGQTTDAYGYLKTNYVYTTADTPIYTVPPTPVRTVTTAKKSTVKAPTPWPTDTPKSPIDLLVVLGAVGLGIVVLRKR